MAELSAHEDKEGMAIASIYHLILLLKGGVLNTGEHAEEKYFLIKKYFLEAERHYHDELKGCKNEHSRKILYNQMRYFYRIAEFYITYLEKLFVLFSFGELSEQASRDKIYFLQKQQLLEGHIMKFLSYSVFSISLFLRRYLFLYALLSGVSMVLFWHGLWGIYDWVIIRMGVETSLTPYLVTSILGMTILCVLGLFLNESVLEKSDVQEIEELEMQEIDELKTIEKIVVSKNKRKK